MVQPRRTLESGRVVEPRYASIAFDAMVQDRIFRALSPEIGGIALRPDSPYRAGAVQSPTRRPASVMFIVSFVLVIVMRMRPS